MAIRREPLPSGGAAFLPVPPNLPPFLSFSSNPAVCVTFNLISRRRLSPRLNPSPSLFHSLSWTSFLISSFSLIANDVFAPAKLAGPGENERGINSSRGLNYIEIEICIDENYRHGPLRTRKSREYSSWLFSFPGDCTFKGLDNSSLFIFLLQRRGKLTSVPT